MYFKIDIVGTEPLLMHNSQLADPLNPFTKALAEVTSKKSKTDDDHAEMARREWLGGLYFDPEIGPYVPGVNVERSLLDAARMNRLGKSIERGVFIQTNENALQYSGSRDMSVLVKDENFRHMASVKIGMKRVMRCRPIFRTWATSAQGYLDESQLDMAELRQIATNAGRLVGLGDWRPRFGRYTAEITVIDDPA
jgi:hypothetical protein